MQKLNMHSKDLTQDNLVKIQAAFPNCVTERQNAQGKVELAVDFDLLRQELSANIVEGPQERYRLDWPGKRESMLTANAPIAKTLRPARDESVNFDDTENLFIEGDNLDALKLLQETYLGKVKMIYIDPPYNTGNDFVYADDFAENSEAFLQRSNQKDQQGNRLVSNSDSNGRYHSDWLSMMFSRLKLARNLLQSDGCILISIDDGEVGNLREICDEVFGSSNFIANIVWQKKYGAANDAKYLSDLHDHILLYTKNKDQWSPHLFPRPEELNAKYKNPDNDPRGPWYSTNLSVKTYSEKNDYIIVSPAGLEFSPPPSRCWGVSQERFNMLLADNRIWFGKDGQSRPYQKTYLSEVQDGVVPTTLWSHHDAGHNIEAKSEIRGLFNNSTGLFDTPKPTRLIERALQMASDKDSIILDFFAGSSTTAHSVMLANAKDGGNRKFVMVQLDEPIDVKSNAYKDGYENVAQISKERIRRAGQQILEGECHEDWNKDIGFRVLKTDTSNMQDVYYQPQQLNQEDLVNNIDNIKADRTAEDLLFQVLLDWGVDLTLPIRRETLQGKDVFVVDNNALLACFDENISEELVHELAELQPLRAVFRDNGFATDAVKVNASQIFKQRSPNTEMKAI